MGVRCGVGVRAVCTGGVWRPSDVWVWRGGNVLRTSDLEYELPAGCIATEPARPRDSARLMVVDRARGRVEHRIVRELPELLGSGDLLVTNASRVLPARFLGVREDTGGRVEGLYLREGARAGTWVAMVKARRFRAGARIGLVSPEGGPTGVAIALVERADESGAWVVEVIGCEGMRTPEVLGRVGLPPIPPYILGARRAEGGAGSGASAGDVGSYQTVFAGELVASGDGTEVGSVAAPTAGLHFTPDLLRAIEARGVERAEVVLHVGPGTFKPVESEFVEQHPMHAEWCMVPGATRGAIERTRATGGRVVCVGTTSARTLEAFAGEAGGEPGEWLHTRLLVTPGYSWRWVDALMTNFHLPRSTLMALVAAMLPGGVDELKGRYAEAIGAGYRFYSYGDAMLVV